MYQNVNNTSRWRIDEYSSDIRIRHSVENFYKHWENNVSEKNLGFYIMLIARNGRNRFILLRFINFSKCIQTRHLDVSKRKKWDMHFLKRHISLWSMKLVNFMKYIELDRWLPSHVGIVGCHCPCCIHDIILSPFIWYPVRQET
jgi:hypothetical protein